MITYKYDENGIFCGTATAQKSPREPGKYLIPANSTELPPPEIGENECAIFENGAWIKKPDFRRTVYWLADGTEHTIDDVGIEPPIDALFEKPVIPPTPQELQARYSQLAQNLLDDKARERNYDGIMSACSYATSQNPKFAAEAAACVAWRDAVWAKCYELLATVLSGEIAIPAENDFLAMLPAFIWPDEAEADNEQTA